MAAPRRSRKSADGGVAQQLDVELNSRLESADLAEKLVATFCDRTGCGSTHRAELMLAVRECVVNAVIHGNRQHPNKKVFLHVELQGASIEICIRDEGGGFDPADIPDPRRPENLLRESGRGLLVIQAMMDRVAVRKAASSGMEVRMIKQLSNSAEEEHEMSLKVTARQNDGVTILDLDGRITLGEPTAALRDTFQDLMTRGQKKVLVNLGGVNYIDSSGLGALVSGFTTVTNQQGQLKLLNLTKKVQDLLQITKLLTVFDVYDDEAAALKSFR